jgi:hypothetical protein
MYEGTCQGASFKTKQDQAISHQPKVNYTLPNLVFALQLTMDLSIDRFLFIVFGWIAVGLLAYQVSFAEPAKAKWDPYTILDISEVGRVHCDEYF